MMLLKSLLEYLLKLQIFNTLNDASQATLEVFA